MVLLSELGGKYELGFVVLVAHFILKREDAFLCAVALCWSILINQHLKLTLAEPRPFFVKAGPIGTPCDDLEYGNPSGHAIAFTSLMLVFMDGVCSTLADLKWGACHLLVKLATVLVISVVIFSRFYFGVHSLDQLASGFLLGLFVYCLSTSIRTDAKVLRVKRMKEQPFQSFADPFFLSFAAAFAGCMCSYYSMENEEIPEAWIENIRKTCPQLSVVESPRLKTFKKLLYSSIFFGIYLGCVIDAKAGPVQFSDSLFNLFVRLSSEPWGAKLQLLVNWALGIIAASVCTLVALKSDALTDRLIGPNLLINAVLTPVIANVFLFGCTRWLIAKMGLLIGEASKPKSD